MDQGGELGELCWCGEVLGCGLGWSAGEVLGSGVAGGLGWGDLFGGLGDDEFCWPG